MVDDDDDGKTAAASSVVVVVVGNVSPVAGNSTLCKQ
jgi:hypothetical protein